MSQARSSQVVGSGSGELATLEALRGGLKFRKDLLSALLVGIREVMLAYSSCCGHPARRCLITVREHSCLGMLRDRRLRRSCIWNAKRVRNP